MVGKGRKKVEINLIKDPSSRMVCFSKRRKGLFKKAEELSTLCGVKIAVLAFSPAGKLYCSDSKTMDSLLCPQADNSSGIQRVNELNSPFAEARAEAMDRNLYCCINTPAVNPPLLLCSQFDISAENDAAFNPLFSGQFDISGENNASFNPLFSGQFDISGENNAAFNPLFSGQFDISAAPLCSQIEMPLQNVYDSSFGGAMVEDPFWNYAFPEAMDGNLCYSDAATLNPLLPLQFDISAAQEEDNCWESDFAEAMAGKEVPFWFNRTNVQAMGSEELRRLEGAIGDYGQLQFAKKCYR